MTDLTNSTFAFIGAGNMSGAILGGMAKNGVPAQNIIATNRTAEKQKALNEKFGVVTNLSNVEAINKADVVILGVKPQMMEATLNELIELGADFKNKLVITVAAGLLVKKYTDILGDIRFIRCMPNTPSLVGLGVSGLYSGTNPSSYSEEQISQDKDIANAMFASVGVTVWLDAESKIDDIAAVSGSGPAYFFLFMESMMEKAKQLGFNQDEAKQIVLQTALGSAQMASESEHSFEQLRINVTSPGGSTAEAIKTFQQQNIGSMVSDALDAAVNRAKEMSKL